MITLEECEQAVAHAETAGTSLTNEEWLKTWAVLTTGLHELGWDAVRTTAKRLALVRPTGGQPTSLEVPMKAMREWKSEMKKHGELE